MRGKAKQTDRDQKKYSLDFLKLEPGYLVCFIQLHYTEDDDGSSYGWGMIDSIAVSVLVELLDEFDKY